MSFIEEISFNAFSERPRFERCIRMHKKMLKVNSKKKGGDIGFAGPSNRNLCRKLGIQTSFVKRDRPSVGRKKKDFARQELARFKATVMEDPFGTLKEYYAMRRFKAMKKKTEILYIYFGIHTSNIVKAHRMEEQQVTKVA